MKNKILFLTLLWTLGVMIPKETGAADEQRRQVTQPPSIPKVTTTNVPPLPPQIPRSVPRVEPLSPDLSVAEIQRQLQNIVQVRQTLQVQNTRELAEIQRITEQARFHQQFLAQLSATPPVASEAKEAASVEAAIRQQKIQIIKKQTEQNREILEDLKSKETDKEEQEKAGSKEKPKKRFWWWTPRQ